MPLQTYLKRPARVEAIAAHEVLDSATHAWADLPEWIRTEYAAGRMLFVNDEIIINNALGQVKAKGTDMLVHDGQILRIMPEAEFADMYAPAEGAP